MNKQLSKAINAARSEVKVLARRQHESKLWKEAFDNAVKNLETLEAQAKQESKDEKYRYI